MESEENHGKPPESFSCPHLGIIPETRTTLPVTQLLYNQFATRTFLFFKSNTTRIKGHLGNFSFHTVRVNTNNSVSTFLSPEMLVESRAAPKARGRGVRSPQPVLGVPRFASSAAVHPKILHRENLIAVLFGLLVFFFFQKKKDFSKNQDTCNNPAARLHISLKCWGNEEQRNPFTKTFVQHLRLILLSLWETALS